MRKTLIYWRKKNIFKFNLKQRLNQGAMRGAYGGRVQFLLGVGTMEFTIIFQFKGLTFIRHNIDSDSPISFGGYYRSSSSEGESSSSSAVLMQNVWRENCLDEDSQSEPINKVLQPTSYSTALSVPIPIQ